MNRWRGGPAAYRGRRLSLLGLLEIGPRVTMWHGWWGRWFNQLITESTITDQCCVWILAWNQAW